MNRRLFLAAAASCTAAVVPLSARASSVTARLRQTVGMLVDISECIGCRKCEYACARQNGLSDAPLESFENPTVFEQVRRPESNVFTVVNRYRNSEDGAHPSYVKIQCMHCLDPACVSACLVGAMSQQENGSVTYDAWKCMGCRYCMVACPFQVPAYEYEKALAPRVRKCNLCFDLVKDGEMPACASMCPPMALTFGNRSDLLELAHDKIASHPDRYVNHVYGEHEVGGTAWLYLLPRSLAELGFLKLGTDPIPELTEAIQRGLFRFGLLPALLFGLLGSVMKVVRERDDVSPGEKEK